MKSDSPLSTIFHRLRPKKASLPLSVVKKKRKQNQQFDRPDLLIYFFNAEVRALFLKGHFLITIKTLGVTFVWLKRHHVSTWRKDSVVSRRNLTASRDVLSGCICVLLGSAI